MVLSFLGVNWCLVVIVMLVDFLACCVVLETLFVAVYVCCVVVEDVDPVFYVVSYFLTAQCCLILVFLVSECTFRFFTFLFKHIFGLAKLC